MDASYLQTSYLGGEVAPSFQGRADHPKYKTGLALSRNGIPVETGSWQRRPGTRVAALTRGGLFARIIDFDFSQDAPFTAEFTAGHLRFFSTYSLVHTYDPETVQSISTATPAVVSVNGNTAYSNGDEVEFTINADLTPEQGALLQDRQFSIGSVSGNQFSLFDTVTAAPIDGSTLNFTAGTPCIVQRVLDLDTPYSLGQLQSIRGVQALQADGTNTLVLLQGKVAPQALISTDPPNPVFDLNPIDFVDGPYQDINKTTRTMTPSAVGPGSITVTASHSPTFAATDVGRHIRLNSKPAAWTSGGTYAAGALVTYANAYYYSLIAANHGNIPGNDATIWGVASNASAWVWGIITAVADDTHATVNIQVTDTTMPGVMVNTNATTEWALGLYSDTTGYPACGAYHEGRLWLGGVVKNRFDGSMSNDIFRFSPSDANGTVADNNAIAYTFNAQDLNTIFWMSPQQTGIIMGTQAAEWLVQASAGGNVLTPTSIQAKRVTKYGSANVEPANAPFATLFVERNNKKAMEYLSFSGQYLGTNVSLTGSHLLAPGIAEVCYQKELVPAAWFRMVDGTFAGMTYRRESPALSEQPSFAGFHSHTLGTGRSVNSIAVGPNVTGDLDTLTMVTYDPSDNLYRVELMTDMFADDGTNLDAWFVDGGTTPAGAFLTPTQLTVYGLNNFEGKTVSLWLAGIDGGDYTVTNGEIVVALPAGTDNLLTAAAIASANDLNNFGPTAMPITYDQVNFPTNAQSMQSYIGPTTPVTGVSADDMLIDLRNNRGFIFKQGNSATDGLRVFDLVSGLQTAQASHGDIFGFGSPFIVDAPYCLGYDGYIYTVNGSSNSTGWIKIDPDTLQIIEQAGLNSANLDLARYDLPYPANFAPARIGGFSFLVGPSLSSSTRTINVAETTNGYMQNAGSSFALTETTGYSCPTVDGAGQVYTLGTSSTAVGLYLTVIGPAAHDFGNWALFPGQDNPAINTIRLGSITAANIDATWTSMSSQSAPCFDQSDGNVMFFASTNDAVTNKNYLVKVNGTSALVMRAIPVASIPSEGGFNMANSIAAYGQFGFISVTGGTGRYYQIDTFAGTATVFTLHGLGSCGASIFDARLGSVFANGSFSQTTGSPTLLNATPTSFASQWFRMIVQDAATIATGHQFYIVPGAIGTTFTSRGQMLRGLSPEVTGARNGPALGKTRRVHRFSALLLNTAGIYFGTAFDKMRPALFKSLGGTAYSANQLYSGVWSDPLDDNNSYDGMLCWQITRPYPATMLASQGFIDTQDR